MRMIETSRRYDSTKGFEVGYPLLFSIHELVLYSLRPVAESHDTWRTFPKVQQCADICTFSAVVSSKKFRLCRS
jgi:hypothetical protein